MWTCQPNLAPSWFKSPLARIGRNFLAHCSRTYITWRPRSGTRHAWPTILLPPRNLSWLAPADPSAPPLPVGLVTADPPQDPIVAVSNGHGFLRGATALGIRARPLLPVEGLMRRRAREGAARRDGARYTPTPSPSSLSIPMWRTTGTKLCRTPLLPPWRRASHGREWMSLGRARWCHQSRWTPTIVV